MNNNLNSTSLEIDKTHEQNIQFVQDLLKQENFAWIDSDQPLDVSYFKSGGGTHLYLIKNGDKKFLARINYYEPNNGWGVKQMEYTVLKLIENLKISPKVYYYCNHKENNMHQDMIIVEYIEGEHLKEIKDAHIIGLAHDLKKLHSAFSYDKFGNDLPPTKNPPYYCDVYDLRAGKADKKIELYSDWAGIEIIIEPFNRIQNKLGTWFKSLKAFAEANKFCLVHCDLKKENIVVHGDDVMLIDWEGAGVDIPELDIGQLFAENKFNTQQRALFLKEYYGDSIEPVSLERIEAIQKVLTFFEILTDFIIYKRKPWDPKAMLGELLEFEKTLV